MYALTLLSALDITYKTTSQNKNFNLMKELLLVMIKRHLQFLVFGLNKKW